MTPLTQNHQHEVEADIHEALPIIQGLLASGKFTHANNEAINDALDILRALRVVAEDRLRKKYRYDQ